MRGALVLGDRTGTLEAAPCESRGGRVRARRGHGRAAGEARAALAAAAEAGEYDLDELLDGPRIPVDRMEADLRALLATIQCDHLRALLDRVFGVGPRRGRCSARRRRPSATTRPTGTGCSSTA